MHKRILAVGLIAVMIAFLFMSNTLKEKTQNFSTKIETAVDYGVRDLSVKASMDKTLAELLLTDKDKLKSEFDLSLIKNLDSYLGAGKYKIENTSIDLTKQLMQAGKVDIYTITYAVTIKYPSGLIIKEMNKNDNMDFTLKIEK